MIQIKVTPNASKNQIVDWTEGVLRLRIKGVPEKGQVNEELIAFLAKQLGIAKSHIEMVSGTTSRIKRLKIAGFTKEQLEERLKP
ncbi:MAG TPA: DUF167 domain-containing protein [Rhabdochlamydiaceae bacterium]